MSKEQTKPAVEATPLPAETGNREATSVIGFDDLAHGQKEVLIEHLGQVYRLRATRNGGLILNK